MKKIYQLKEIESIFYEKVKKTETVMKVCFLFLLILCVSVPQTGYSQTEKVTLKVETVTIKEFLKKLKETTGVDFIYSTNLFDGTEKVTVNVKNEELNSVLNMVLTPKGFTYVYNNGAIVIRRAEKKSPIRKSITGIVTDKNKEPLAGALITLSNSQNGAVTEAKGRYSLTLIDSENEVLTFTFVGKKSVTVPYKGESTINVTMDDDNLNIDEVVVDGYQTFKQISSAGSISKVKAENLLLNGVNSLEQALQGQIAGLSTISKSGLTGTRQRTRVRGTSTMLGNAEPVWVVDGMIQTDPLPFKSNDLTNMNPDNMDMIRDFIGGAISWLNPNDIEDVTVLKDAASTAIYGVKAANGVIVINTKKGKIGRMAVSYSGGVSFTPRMNYDKMELMNSQQRVDVSREAFEKGIPLAGNGNFDIGYTALANRFRKGDITLEEFSRDAKILETTNTDWFDILFRDAFSHNHSISISGGKDNTTYRTSVGANRINNTAKGNDNTNYTASTNITTKLWDRVTLSSSLSANIGKTNAFLGVDPYGYASTVNRVIPAYNEDGSNYFYRDNSGSSYLYNIENELSNSGNTNTQSSINAMIDLQCEITKNLRFTTAFSYGYRNSVGESWYTEQSHYIAKKRGYNYGQFEEGSPQYMSSQLPMGGELNQMQNSAMMWSWRNQLEYRKIFLYKHSLTVMIGEESSSNTVMGNSRRTYGYLPDRGKIVVGIPPKSGNDVNSFLNEVPTIVDTKLNLMSYYATLNYMFDERYALNASVRADASNRFGQDKSARYQPVWAFGLRWNLGREHWMQNQSIVSDMSFRFSYGYQGNVVEGVSPDLIATIQTTTNGYELKLKDLPAPELTWEKVTSLNFGVDWSLFNNKINGTFEWYSKETKDMVTEMDVPFENGVSTRRVNGGNMSNRGWDLSANFVPIKRGDWMLSCGVNIGKVINELTSTVETNGAWKNVTTGNYAKEGYPVSSFWAFKFIGLDPTHGGPLYDLSGVTGDYAKDATLYMDYAGKIDPDFTAGINLALRYKSFSLSTGLYLSLGNQSFLAPAANDMIKTIPSEYLNMSTEWVDRWRKPGDEKFTNVPALPSVEHNAEEIVLNGGRVRFYPYDIYSYSTARVVDAWFLRCSNINLSYAVPTSILPKGIQHIGLNCSVTNPFIIRSNDFKGRDPEVALGKQPLSRTVTLGASISF